MTNGRPNQGAAAPQAAASRRWLRMRPYRSFVAFGLVASLVLGVTVDASSQQPAKAPAAPKQAPKQAPKKDPKKKAPAEPAASAAPTNDTPVTPVSTATTPMPTTTTVRKPAPPPPPPDDAKLRALEQLGKDAELYQKDAKEFRDAVTTIVKHHYEQRRRRILSSLDREIAIESAELKKARIEAIARLEEFVARYSGANAHPEHTPDAMFRLAALYEERASDYPPEQQIESLKPAIALYKRVIREFPNYRERAAIFYYLGHALNNSARGPEAQQVWRSLVCNNRYPYPVPVDPTDPDKDLIVKKPQDHDTKYWDAWESLHPEPIGLAAAKDKGKKGFKKAAPALPNPDKKATKTTKSGEEEPIDSSEETVYRNIYPDECTSVPQKTEPGKEPRYIAEIWWQIGEHHFELGDVKGRPFNYNRAITAYRQSMKTVTDKIRKAVYAVSMYKMAWTYYKQQRYRNAVAQFVDLLKHTDEMEKLTGDAGADFRKEAAEYIAGSVTFLDFDGPAEDEPYIVRPDPVLDSGKPPSEQERLMRVGIDRVMDEKLIPQDRKWTIEIYRALAKEYHELGQFGNETIVLEAILKKWPLHRDAPLIQDELARVYDRRAELAQPGSAEAAAFASKALESRTALADYVAKDGGETPPWVEANKDDPEAIQRAERLVKGGLRTAAVQHTLNARDFMGRARQSTDLNEQTTMLTKALDEFRLAEKGWGAYLGQDPNATDAYESRYWVADSRYHQVEIMVALQQPVPPKLYADARAAAAEVRDSNEDDRFLAPSANYVVALADLALNEQYKIAETTNGAQGVVKKERLGIQGEGTSIKIDDAPPPPPVLAAIAARDEYVGRVPPQSDPTHNADLYQFASAEYFFLYGQFDEATKRFEAIQKEQCKKTKYGFEAQLKLQQMANVKAEQTGDFTRAKALAEAAQNPETNCAISDADKERLKDLSGTTIQTGAYVSAYNAFKKAQEMEDGPERVKQWRTAGELYEVALKAAPDRQEAPEAALNGAYSYKQVGDYDKAIEMYRLFIDKYGDEKILQKLEKGSEKEKAQYRERVEGLIKAYEALSQAYVLFFNYRAAAETADKIASIERFPQDKRKLSAYNALVLYSNLGDRDKMTTARAKYLTFKPSAEEKAEADYIVASSDLKQWDERGDSDNNKSARTKAQASMTKFFEDNKRNAAAARYNVNAAYWVAKMKTSAGGNADDWWKNTIAAFQQYKASNPKVAYGSPEATFAAEADFTMADAEIKKNFDYDSGHHRFKGTITEVMKKYGESAKDAKKYNDRLDKIASPQETVNSYGSLEYIITATARQGSLYDSVRTGFYNTREPALKLFTPAEEALLNKLENSDNPEYMDKAALFRDNRTQLWRKKRDEELKANDSNMVGKYALAVALARKYNVRSPAVKKAMQRLAYFTDLLGDAKMAEYTAPIAKDPNLGFTYQEGMFQKTRPGMVVEPELNALPAPLPAAVK
jgi:tetratricopeptide (TPR) repeat protein